ncbi:hypothetical protein [Nisaea denitrificans]|nr:hypothetical protein [Nisaea denitrificans]
MIGPVVSDVVPDSHAVSLDCQQSYNPVFSQNAEPQNKSSPGEAGLLT